MAKFEREEQEHEKARLEESRIAKEKRKDELWKQWCECAEKLRLERSSTGGSSKKGSESEAELEKEDAMQKRLQVLIKNEQQLLPELQQEIGGSTKKLNEAKGSFKECQCDEESTMASWEAACRETRRIESLMATEEARNASLKEKEQSQRSRLDALIAFGGPGQVGEPEAKKMPVDLLHVQPKPRFQEREVDRIKKALRPPFELLEGHTVPGSAEYNRRTWLQDQETRQKLCSYFLRHGVDISDHIQKRCWPRRRSQCLSSLRLIRIGKWLCG